MFKLPTEYEEDPYINNFYSTKYDELARDRFLEALPSRLPVIKSSDTAVQECELKSNASSREEILELRPYLRPRSSEREVLLSQGGQQKSCRWNEKRTSYCRKAEAESLDNFTPKYYFQKYVTSSSIWESRVFITFFTALTTILIVLIHLNVIPQSQIYPMEETPFGYISGFFIFTFSALVVASYSRYDSPVKQFNVGLLGNLTDASMNITSLLVDDKCVKPIPDIRYIMDSSSPTGWRLRYCMNKACNVLNDMRYVMKALPFAMKITFRDRVEVDVYKLPLLPHLKDELLCTTGNSGNYLDGLRRMYVHRVAQLRENDMLGSSSVTVLVNHSNSIGSNIGEITYSRKIFSLSTTLESTMRLSVYSWLLFVPFYLYQFWGFVMTLILSAFMNLLFLGIISTLNTIRNPFSKNNINEFLGIDLGQEARNVAQIIDQYFDLVFMEFAAFQEVRNSIPT